ncbi:MAG: hypothetical protein ACTICF_11150, partial [Corynebacterium variabile]|uniref:hypothetical protein n=2 Tax=Corynebacterium variabile TaxID=1727 RepID=UPI003F93A2FA
GDGHIDPAVPLPLLFDDLDAVRKPGNIRVDLFRDGLAFRSRSGIVRGERRCGRRGDIPGLRPRRPVIDRMLRGIFLGSNDPV